MWDVSKAQTFNFSSNQYNQAADVGRFESSVIYFFQ